MKFRKKPVVIDAWLWDGNTDKPWERAPEWLADEVAHWGPRLAIPTLEGIITAQPGDWIIRGIHGEIYPCKPDIFAKTYERVEDEHPDKNR